LSPTPPFNERSGSVSPDGRWLLYDASPSGATQVYVRTFPNTSTSQWQVSSAGGMWPKWARDGKAIFFENPRRLELVRVEVLPGPTFQLGEQRVVTSLEGILSWDVAPDGKRIIAAREPRPPSDNLVVVENLLVELKGKEAKR